MPYNQGWAGYARLFNQPSQGKYAALERQYSQSSPLFHLFKCTLSFCRSREGLTPGISRASRSETTMFINM